MFTCASKIHNEIFCVGGGDKLVRGGHTFLYLSGGMGVTNFVCVGGYNCHGGSHILYLSGRVTNFVCVGGGDKLVMGGSHIFVLVRGYGG